MSKIDHLATYEATTPATAEQAEVDLLLERFFGNGQGQDGDRTTFGLISATELDAHPRRDFDTAFELLGRASQAFDLLISRCQILDHDLDDANERLRVQAVEKDETIEQWKRLASGLKAQAQAAKRDASALRGRCETAEARATAAERKLETLRHVSNEVAERAAAADTISTKLHDRVVAAFGRGSRAHPVLEAIATQFAAE